MAATENLSLAGHKLLILMPFDPALEYISDLENAFTDLEVSWHKTNISGYVDFSPYKDITILCTHSIFPTPAQAPNLKFIQLSSAGANHCHDNPLYKNPAITFCTANGVHPPQIGEWVIGTFLAFQHQIPKYLSLMNDGEWEENIEPEVDDAVGMRMGILGYGSIGRQCARLGKALGMDVIAYTLHERESPAKVGDDGYIVPGTGDPKGEFPSKWFHGPTKKDLNTFLRQDLDILVICLPLTALTNNMIAKEQFEILSQRKTFVSNVGRGSQINTKDLIEALENGMICGAALDVTDPEPLPKNHPLWKAPNVIITPHVSWQTKQYSKRVLAILDFNLKRLSNGKPQVNMVDRVLGY